jgi:uncharacterized protein
MPPYAYVPGGPWPHPVSAPGGHSAGRAPRRARPINEGRWADSAEYMRGLSLFNAGYYWESHEAWEALWHAHGRHGAVADLLKGLIKLAAAGLKVREGRPAGVATHASRAAALFEAVRAIGEPRVLGLDLDLLIEKAHAVAANPPNDTSPPGAAVARVFDFNLEPE